MLIKYNKNYIRMTQPQENQPNGTAESPIISEQEQPYNRWERIPQTPQKTVQFQQNNGIIQREKNMCSNCNVKGHYFQNCPNIECSLCKKKGHIGRFCPERTCQICNQKGHIER